MQCANGNAMHGAGVTTLCFTLCVDEQMPLHWKPGLYNTFNASLKTYIYIPSNEYLSLASNAEGIIQSNPG